MLKKNILFSNSVDVLDIVHDISGYICIANTNPPLRGGGVHISIYHLGRKSEKCERIKKQKKKKRKTEK
jgi:hypothetical protein